MTLSNNALKIIELVGIKELPESELSKLNLNEYNLEKFDTLLQSYLDKGDWRSFRVLFWYLPTTLSEVEREALTREYILDYSHFEHEEMILGFSRRYFNEENISVIVKLINNPPQYFLDIEREYVFIEKCFTALKAQKYPKCFEALKDLADATKDETVRKMAIYLIENWNHKIVG